MLDIQNYQAFKAFKVSQDLKKFLISYDIRGKVQILFYVIELFENFQMKDLNSHPLNGGRKESHMNEKKRRKGERAREKRREKEREEEEEEEKRKRRCVKENTE